MSSPSESPSLSRTHTRTQHHTRNTSTADRHAHLHTATAPLPFFHPTRAKGSLTAGAGGDVRWRSRASRKRLYTSKPVSVQHEHRTRKRSVEEGKGEKKEPWLADLRVHHAGAEQKLHPRVQADVSFWVAVTFVLGSIAWVINAFLLYMPLVAPSVPQREKQAAAWAFVGGTLFEVGSYLMLVESLNTGHGQLFGPSVESFFEGKPGGEKKEGVGNGEKFVWMGVRSPRDLGYLASAVQMFAATIFWVSTITGLPGVIPGFPETSSVAITDIFFWTPQVIGGCGFIVSSLLLMLEEQSVWWKFGVKRLGWHIALWNLVGAVGFMLCGAFGYDSVNSSWQNYQSVLSTFWGSWAFLIGSILQLGETIWRE